DKAGSALTAISRSSKPPPTIYLANRGIRTANIPLVPGLEPPGELLKLDRPLVVGLLASAERIAQIRRSRLLSLNENRETLYVDRDAINAELLEMRRPCARPSWPVI